MLPPCARAGADARKGTGGRPCDMRVTEFCTDLAMDVVRVSGGGDGGEVKVVKESLGRDVGATQVTVEVHFVGLSDVDARLAQGELGEVAPEAPYVPGPTEAISFKSKIMDAAKVIPNAVKLIYAAVMPRKSIKGRNSAGNRVKQNKGSEEVGLEDKEHDACLCA